MREDNSEVYSKTDWEGLADKLYDVIRTIKPDLMCGGNYEREQGLVREYMNVKKNYKPFYP